MKKHSHLSFFILICFILFNIASCKNSPDFIYHDGSTGEFTDFDGHWVLINYWAEWCKPCVDEIPELNKFAQSNNKIIVLGINFDKVTMEQEKVMMQKLNIQFPVIHSIKTQSFDKKYSYQYPQALPTSILISPDGKLRKVLYGPQNLENLTNAMNN